MDDEYLKYWLFSIVFGIIIALVTIFGFKKGVV